jgi:hypothetical protein
MHNKSVSTTFDIEGLGDMLAHPDMRLKLTYSSQAMAQGPSAQDTVPPAFAAANLITLVPDTTTLDGAPVLDDLKLAGALQDYQPGEGSFRDHVAETLAGLQSSCSWIQYDGDHVTYELYMTMKNLLMLDEASLDGWSIEACLDKA